ncbi:MAG: HAD family hydrolase [Treponema sp.]|nr:HAD family hydrolase [Treponema sp.]
MNTSELNSPSWLFFDIGSTLVDETKVYEGRFKYIAEKSGLSYDEVCASVLELFKQNKKGDKELMKRLGIPILEWKSEDEVLYLDTKSFLQKLSWKTGGKYKIGIIANQNLGSKERLESFGILEYIDLVVASAEEGCAKPDRKIFEIALSRAGVQAVDSVMIGDRIDNDIIPANEIGMKTLWVKQGYGKYWSFSSDPESRKVEKADFEVDDLSGLLKIF